MANEYPKKFVSDLTNEIVQIIQRVDQTRTVFKTVVSKDKLEYHPNYYETVEMCDRIKMHAELQSFPERLFRVRNTRMTDDEMNYLKANYKQVTMPVYLDFLATISRIFHDTNYTLSFDKEDKEAKDTLQEYLEKGFPELGSLETYIKSVVTHQKFTDANGIIAIRPREIKYVDTDDGQRVVDDMQLHEPLPYFFPSKSVLREETGEYALVLTEEKSAVEYGGVKNQMKGYVMEFYDSQNIWRIEQYGQFEKYLFRIRLFYPHHWGKVPCIKMKGVPSLRNGKLMWVSPFMYAVDLLDLVAVNSQFLQVIINNCVFPYRVMYGDDCEFEYKDKHGAASTCDMGYVYDSDLDAKIICPRCGGTGLKSRINPFGVMLIRTGGNYTDKDIPQTPMAYIEPSIETPKFLMGKIGDDEMKARRILHLNTSQTQVQGGVEQMNPAANTATGMITDLKALYAFVKPISDQIFEIWEFIIDAIGFMRYGSQYKKPSLTYPVTFDFYTEQDYMEVIAMAVKSGMPPFVIQTYLFKFFQGIFYNEKKTANVFNLIYSTDRLLTMSRADVAACLSRGTVEKWESVLHDSALTFVQQLTNADDKFFKMKFADQQTALITVAKERADAITEATQAEQAEQAELNIDNIMKTARQSAAA